MKRKVVGFSMLALMLALSWNACNPPKPSEPTDTYPPTDQLANPGPEYVYNRLLLRHVNRKGMVNYKGLVRDSVKLNIYLNHLEASSPEDSAWNDAHELAFWINAYNAFTLRLIVRHYPIVSPLDIGIVTPDLGTPDYEIIAQSGAAVYDLHFITIGDSLYSLNEIRDRKIREPFHEPRAHFALCNGTKSAPSLSMESYNADRINKQLEEATRNFLFLPEKNIIHPNQPQLSEIFRDFRADFGPADKNIYSFINRYVPARINEDAQLRYLPYNWLLNDSD